MTFFEISGGKGKAGVNSGGFNLYIAGTLALAFHIGNGFFMIRPTLKTGETIAYYKGHWTIPPRNWVRVVTRWIREPL